MVEEVLRGGDFLHQAETIGFVGVEFVAGEQPAHGVAPAGDLVHAQCRATEREDSALHFELGEARVAGAEVDVGRQHQFDADGVAVALHGHHQRLAWTPAAEGAPGIDGAFGEFPALAEGLADIGQVQPGGEMLAVGEEQGTAQLVVGLVFAERGDQVVEHRQVEGVALGHAVEAEQQQVAAPFAADASWEGVVHAAVSWRGRATSV